MPVMILNAPWYISVPLFSWFLNAAIGQGWICPWTALENKYRKKVGMPTIDTFVKHYYIKPYIRYKVRNKYKEKLIKWKINLHILFNVSDNEFTFQSMKF